MKSTDLLLLQTLFSERQTSLALARPAFDTFLTQDSRRRERKGTSRHPEPLEPFHETKRDILWRNSAFTLTEKERKKSFFFWRVREWQIRFRSKFGCCCKRRKTPAKNKEGGRKRSNRTPC